MELVPITLCDVVTVPPCGHTLDLRVSVVPSVVREAGIASVSLSPHPDDVEQLRQILEGETACPKCEV